MSKPVSLPSLSTFPEYQKQLSKLLEIQGRIQKMKRERPYPPLKAPPVELNLTQLAGVFLSDGPEALPAATKAPRLKQEDLEESDRLIEILDRAEEIQQATVDAELGRISAKVCRQMEGDLERIADEVATHLHAACEAAKKARPVYEHLVQGGFRLPPHFEQRQLRVDTYERILSGGELDPQALGFGVGPVLRRLADAGMIEPGHPGARAAKLS